VASLLEVGTGFHPELTGRENIFLNGAILGMTRAEIKKKFDEIVDFAEIEKFLDTPVKRYSSGMYVRLAFAVAAHLDPEILLVDEVLAVGDAQFQKKCLGKMEDVSMREGRTVLFVSHNMGAIKQLCHKVLLLDKGRANQIGSVETITRSYLLDTINRNPSYENSFQGTLARIIKITSININNNDSEQVLIDNREEIIVVVTGNCSQQISNFVFSFAVYKDDVRVFTQHDSLTPKKLLKGDFKTMVTFPRYLLRPGEYYFAFGGHDASSKDWFFGTCLKYFLVLETWSENNVAINYGLVNVSCIDSYRISNGEHIC
jgi:lipopolysaccharide transport system ATP-binding protein